MQRGRLQSELLPSQELYAIACGYPAAAIQLSASVPELSSASPLDLWTQFATSSLSAHKVLQLAATVSETEAASAVPWPHIMGLLAGMAYCARVHELSGSALTDDVSEAVIAAAEATSAPSPFVFGLVRGLASLLPLSDQHLITSINDSEEAHRAFLRAAGVDTLLDAPTVRRVVDLICSIVNSLIECVKRGHRTTALLLALKTESVIQLLRNSAAVAE